jgi:hypothetical protein
VSDHTEAGGSTEIRRSQGEGRERVRNIVCGVWHEEIACPAHPRPTEKLALADEVLDQFGPATGMSMTDIDAATRRL